MAATADRINVTMPVQAHFPDNHAILRASKDAARTRTVKGEGNGVLRVSEVVGPDGRKYDLVACDYVRCGSTIMTPTDERQHLKRISTDGYKERDTVLHHVMRIQELEDGTRILERSVESNFGVWQKGVDFHVVGDWELSGSERAKDSTPLKMDVEDPFATPAKPKVKA